MSDQEKNLEDTLSKLRQIQEDSSKMWNDECDEWWNNLDSAEKQTAFYSVMKRIYQYRIVEGHGYRGTLYDGFGFDPSAYRMGMQCNFFDLHNMIFDAQELEAMKGVTRFEVIDDKGRSYVKYLKDDERVKFGLQDDDRTLKVFIDSHMWKEDL